MFVKAQTGSLESINIEFTKITYQNSDSYSLIKEIATKMCQGNRTSVQRV